MFYEGRIPGVVVSRALLELGQKHAQSPDGGKAFFSEFAAKQIAIYRGLGYRGVYIGGVHSFPAIENILAIEKSFAPDDWKQFAREIRFSRAGEFFYFAEDPATGLADATKRQAHPPADSRHVTPAYQISKWAHDTMFAPGAAFAKWGAKICAAAKDSFQGPRPLRALEHLSKSALYQCRDCGDCSLPDIAFLCPESQCAKNQRNGPCGGTREGRCEVDGYGDCIWLRAYERWQHDGQEQALLEHSPVVQNQGLRGTSAWANNWLGRDHAAKKTSSPEKSQPAPEPKPAVV
jgi:methylenetetrahydrofolate reductase (NADPH)